MIDGKHTVDADEMSTFRESLLRQARQDGVELDIFQSDNRDGTFDLAWHVRQPATPASDRVPDPANLLQQAQGTLMLLLRQTTNQAIRASVQQQIDGLGRLLASIPATLDQQAANDLNDASDDLVTAFQSTAGADPASPAASQMRDSVIQIGNVLGAAAHAALGSADEVVDASPLPVAGLLRPDGEALFESCVIRPERLAEAKRAASRVVANATRYHEVADRLGGLIPWFLIGIIHSLESNFSFTTHLHNGDPLSARTRQVPAGRPAGGSPPFRWEDSACDALQLKKLDQVPAWPLPVILDRLERYNGTGYVSRGINSPYLWSFSQHWTRGKFVHDHQFDPNATSGQCGSAVILKALVLAGTVVLADGLAHPDRAPDADAALGHRLVAAPVLAEIEPESARAELEFPGILQADPAQSMAARRVQEWCTFAGSPTTIDGGFGDGTATAVAVFQAREGINPATGVVDLRTWSALTRPMLRALTPLATLPISLGAAVVAVARQHAAQSPQEIGGDNKGAWVRLYMDGVDGAAQEWCAGFACFVVEQAARALGLPSPFPRRLSVAALIGDAKASGRLVPGSSVTSPAARLARLQPGCLFAIKQPNLSHAGIVVELRGDGLTTVEGNTSGKAAVDGRGFEVLVSSRNYDGKDFILLA